VRGGQSRIDGTARAEAYVSTVRSMQEDDLKPVARVSGEMALPMWNTSLLCTTGLALSPGETHSYHNDNPLSPLSLLPLNLLSLPAPTISSLSAPGGFWLQVRQAQLHQGEGVAVPQSIENAAAGRGILKGNCSGQSHRTEPNCRDHPGSVEKGRRGSGTEHCCCCCCCCCRGRPPVILPPDGSCRVHEVGKEALVPSAGEPPIGRRCSIPSEAISVTKPPGGAIDKAL
jgi:hypothetical protein